jgi:hypothetical protein
MPIPASAFLLSGGPQMKFDIKKCSTREVYNLINGLVDPFGHQWHLGTPI